MTLGARICGATLLVLSLPAAMAGTGTAEVDVGALVDETQRQSPNEDILDLVWWVPTEFWRATLASDPSITGDDIEKFESTVAPYNVVAVAFGEFGLLGGVTWHTEKQIRETIVLIDNAGREHRPLAQSDVHADVRQIGTFLKAMMSGALGPMGENLQFYFFPNRDPQGALIVDPYREGAFAIRLQNERYEFELPLASLLPPKRCPVDGKRLKGTWRYCPWHGDKLETIDAAADPPAADRP